LIPLEETSLQQEVKKGMAKKQGKVAAKKPARTVKSKSATPAKRSASKGRAAKKEEKYEQAGAPWWKMHLPE
jgi:hypothetical protein